VTEARTALAVRKSVVVACPVERAFEVFTREVGSWWPTHTHSIGAEKITEIVFEEQLGGRIYETHADGGEGEWGRVLLWEPPSRFAMSWHPGHDAARAMRLEVSFAAEGEGTRVDLEHTGWELLADEAAGAVSAYDEGWDYVLGYYTRNLED
jgi:uncharacterized protein YndB with AHSA1/START domain